MTRKQAIVCMCCEIPVENKNDEDLKTGLIQEVVNDRYCIVLWDEDEGILTIDETRNLVVQYPEQLEVA
jgi:hypothetical protein